MGRFLYRAWRWLIHPIAMIVLVQSAWTLALVLWIRFFVGRYSQAAELATAKGLRVQDLVTWAPLVVGIVLLALIFTGTLALIFWLVRQFLLNRQMKNFLSFASHELRTPITSIRLMLETLRDNPLAEEQRGEFIENMLEDADRLARQIALILDASRLERRRLPLRLEPLELPQLVRRYAENHARTPQGADHELVVGETAPAAVRADRDLLAAVLDNLVNNAERYSPPGTRITLSVTAKGKWAMLRVRDEGAGVEPGERKKIFQLFYRGAAAQRASRRGSGLGLYLVKGIVAMHDGRVDVQSEGAGRGSTFQVRLPRVRANGEDSAS